MSEIRKGHSKTTPVKSTPTKGQKKHSFQNLTSQKYLNVKLDYSEHKKIAMEKTIELKNERIRQLEVQIRDNQKLVNETLRKWKDYRKGIEEGGKNQQKQLTQRLQEMNMNFAHMHQQIKRKQSQNNALRENAQRSEDQKKQIEEKYEKLEKKYKEERRQWKQTMDMVKPLLEFVYSLPPEVLEQTYN